MTQLKRLITTTSDLNDSLNRWSSGSLFALARTPLYSSCVLSTWCVGPRSRGAELSGKEKILYIQGDTSQGYIRAILHKSFLCLKAVAKKSTNKINCALESTRHLELAVLVTSCPLPRGAYAHVCVSLGCRWGWVSIWQQVLPLLPCQVPSCWLGSRPGDRLSVLYEHSIQTRGAWEEAWTEHTCKHCWNQSPWGGGLLSTFIRDIICQVWGHNGEYRYPLPSFYSPLTWTHTHMLAHPGSRTKTSDTI